MINKIKTNLKYMDWVLVLFVMMGFGRSAEGDPSLIELKEALWPEEGLSSWSDIISTLNGVLTIIFYEYL